MEHTKRLFLESTGINKVIFYLTISDIFTWGIYLVVTAFTGLFLQTKLNMDIVEIVGIGTAVFYFARVMFQIPVGWLTDRVRTDRDEITLLIIGNILMGIPYLLYPSISSPAAFYLLQFMIGVGGSLNLVNWRKLFAANLNDGSSGKAYAIYDTMMSLAMVFLGFVGGQIAGLGESSFNLVVSAAGVLMIVSGIWPLLIFLSNRKSKIVL